MAMTTMRRRIHITHQSIVQLGSILFLGRLEQRPYQAMLREAQPTYKGKFSSPFIRHCRGFIRNTTSGFETLQFKENVEKLKSSQQKAMKIIRA